MANRVDPGDGLGKASAREPLLNNGGDNAVERAAASAHRALRCFSDLRRARAAATASTAHEHAHPRTSKRMSILRSGDAHRHPHRNKASLHVTWRTVLAGDETTVEDARAQQLAEADDRERRQRKKNLTKLARLPTLTIEELMIPLRLAFPYRISHSVIAACLDIIGDLFELGWVIKIVREQPSAKELMARELQRKQMAEEAAEGGTASDGAAVAVADMKEADDSVYTIMHGLRDVGTIVSLHFARVLYVFWDDSTLWTLVQVVRCLRVGQLVSYVSQINNDLTMNVKLLAAYKFLLVLISVPHWIACFWWALPAEWTEPALELPSWPAQVPLVTHNPELAPHAAPSEWYSYLMALYMAWMGLTSMGYGTIVIATQQEVIFAALVAMIQMVFYAFVLGTLFHYLVRTDENTVHFNELMKAVDEYVSTRKLPPALASKIRSHYAFQHRKQAAGTQRIVAQMPLSMRTEVAVAQYARQMHATWAFWGCTPQFLSHVALFLRERNMMPSETLFKRGDVGAELLWCVGGSLHVTKGEAHIRTIRSDIGAGAIVGEVAFFVGIQQPYTVTATSNGEVTLIVLSVSAFDEIIGSYPEQTDQITQNLLRKYGLDKNGADVPGGGLAEQMDEGELKEFLELREAIRTAIIERNEEMFAQMADAVHSGDVETVRSLTARGFDLSSGSYDLRTPLHLAALEGHRLVAKVLCELGADVSQLDRFGHAPLNDALDARHGAVADELGRYGAQLRCVRPAEKLHAAAKAGDMELMTMAVRHGIDINARSYDGRTALHVAAAEGNSRVAEFLVTNMADVHARDRWAHSPLDDAIQHNHPLLAQMLVRSSASSDPGTMAELLRRAAGEGDVERLGFVLQMGCKVNEADYDRRTALHYAVAAGSVSATHALVAALADVNLADRWLQPPLVQALDTSPQIAALLARACGASLPDSASGAERARLQGALDACATLDMYELNRRISARAEQRAANTELLLVKAREVEVSVNALADAMASMARAHLSLFRTLERWADIWIAEYGEDDGGSDTESSSGSGSDESGGGGGGGRGRGARHAGRQGGGGAEGDGRGMASASKQFLRLVLQLPHAESGLVRLSALFRERLPADANCAMPDAVRRAEEERTLRHILTSVLGVDAHSADAVLAEIYEELRALLGAAAPMPAGMGGGALGVPLRTAADRLAVPPPSQHAAAEPSAAALAAGARAAGAPEVATSAAAASTPSSDGSAADEGSSLRSDEQRDGSAQSASFGRAAAAADSPPQQRGDSPATGGGGGGGGSPGGGSGRAGGSFEQGSFRNDKVIDVLRRGSMTGTTLVDLTRHLHRGSISAGSSSFLGGAAPRAATRPSHATVAAAVAATRAGAAKLSPRLQPLEQGAADDDASQQPVYLSDLGHVVLFCSSTLLDVLVRRSLARSGGATPGTTRSSFGSQGGGRSGREDGGSWSAAASSPRSPPHSKRLSTTLGRVLHSLGGGGGARHGDEGLQGDASATASMEEGESGGRLRMTLSQLADATGKDGGGRAHETLRRDVEGSARIILALFRVFDADDSGVVHMRDVRKLQRELGEFGSEEIRSLVTHLMDASRAMQPRAEPEPAPALEGRRLSPLAEHARAERAAGALPPGGARAENPFGLSEAAQARRRRSLKHGQRKQRSPSGASSTPSYLSLGAPLGYDRPSPDGWEEASLPLEERLEKSAEGAGASSDEAELLEGAELFADADEAAEPPLGAAEAMSDGLEPGTTAGGGAQLRPRGRGAARAADEARKPSFLSEEQLAGPTAEHEALYASLDEAGTIAPGGAGGAPDGLGLRGRAAAVRSMTKVQFFVGVSSWILVSASEVAHPDEEEDAVARVRREAKAAQDARASRMSAAEKAMSEQEAAARRSRKLEAHLTLAMESAAAFSLLADNIQHRVDKGRVGAAERVESGALLKFVAHAVAIPASARAETVEAWCDKRLGLTLEKQGAGAEQRGGGGGPQPPEEAPLDDGSNFGGDVAGAEAAAAAATTTWQVLIDALRDEATALRLVESGVDSVDGGGGSARQRGGAGSGLLAAVGLGGGGGGGARRGADGGGGGTAAAEHAAEPGGAPDSAWYVMSRRSAVCVLVHRAFLGLVVWDALVGPMSLAYIDCFARMPWLFYVNFGIDACYLVRIGLQFFTSFVNEKSVEVFAPAKIWRHYLQRDFVGDVFACWPHDKLAWLLGAGPFVQLSLRLLRYVNVRYVLRAWGAWKRGLSQADFASGLVRNIAPLLCTMHYSACVANVLGYSNLAQRLAYTTWADIYDRERDALLRGSSSEYGSPEAELTHHYLTAVFLVLSLITGLGLAQLPANYAEALAFVLLGVTNMTIYAWAVGGISGLVMKQDDEIVGKRAQLELVTAYVRHIHAPAELKERMVRFFQHRLQTTSLSSVDAEQIYTGLPVPLQMEVATHTNRALVTGCLLLRGCAAGFLDRLSAALRERELDAEAVVFRAGEACKELLLIASGVVELLDEGAEGAEEGGEAGLELMGPGDTLGEVPFIFSIRHFKTARVGQEKKAVTFSLSQEQFRELLKAFPSQEDVLMDNAMRRHDGMSGAKSVRSGRSAGSKRAASEAGRSERSEVSKSAAGGAKSEVDAGPVTGVDALHKILTEAKRKREELLHSRLCTACAKGDLEKVRRLLSGRASDVDHGDFGGRRVLHLAACGGEPRVIELLLGQKADVNVEDAQGCTPLDAALMADKEAAAALLARHGGRPGSRDVSDHVCTAAGDADGGRDLARLCQYGGNVNATSSEGRTALHIAASEGRAANVRKLLELRADINARDARGSTPLQDALLGRQDEVCALLLQSGAALGELDVAKALNTAAAANDTAHLGRLLRFRCDVNAQDGVGRCALHLASASRCVNATSLLLDAEGVAVNAEDAHGNTALDDALREGCAEQRVLVALLESRGAKPGSHAKRAQLVERHTDVEERREQQTADTIQARDATLGHATELSAWLAEERAAGSEFRAQLDAAVRLQREHGAVLADELPELWAQVHAYAEGFFDWRDDAASDVRRVVERMASDTTDFALISAHKLLAKMDDMLEIARNEAKPLERLYEVTFRKPSKSSHSGPDGKPPWNPNA